MTNGMNPKTHGLTKHPLYAVRNRMKSACYNSNYVDYKNYGKRGIKVCDEWMNDFLAFYNWAMDNGYSKGKTIERIDVNGDYCPENCTWIPNKEQANNRTTSHYLTYKEKTQTIKDWSIQLGLSYKLFHKHLTKMNFELEQTIIHYNPDKLKLLFEIGEKQ